jgi:hypothetical protein
MRGDERTQEGMFSYVSLEQRVPADRLLTSDVAQQFFAEVNKQAKKFMSDEHFTVDGTLIQAWAALLMLAEKSTRSCTPHHCGRRQGI